MYSAFPEFLAVLHTTPPLCWSDATTSGCGRGDSHDPTFEETTPMAEVMLLLFERPSPRAKKRQLLWTRPKFQETTMFPSFPASEPPPSRVPANRRRNPSTPTQTPRLPAPRSALASNAPRTGPLPPRLPKRRAPLRRLYSKEELRADRRFEHVPAKTAPRPRDPTLTLPQGNLPTGYIPEDLGTVGIVERNNNKTSPCITRPRSGPARPGTNGCCRTLQQCAGASCR